MKQNFYDVIFFTAFTVFGLILWFLIPYLLPGKPGFQLDTRLFPRIIAVLLIVVGLVNAVAACTSLRKKQESEPPDETANFGTAKNFRAPGMVVVMLLYAYLMEPLGFLLASFVAATAILILQKIRKIHSYIAVYAASYTIYCLFHYLLMVQLP
jgi:putative tricarboxylic transport membrane protein